MKTWKVEVLKLPITSEFYRLGKYFIESNTLSVLKENVGFLGWKSHYMLVLGPAGGIAQSVMCGLRV